MDLLGPKLLFVALNLGGLALGVWKVNISLASLIAFSVMISLKEPSFLNIRCSWQLNTLGLLPTHASDWVSSLPPAQVLFILPWTIQFCLECGPCCIHEGCLLQFRSLSLTLSLCWRVTRLYILPQKASFKCLVALGCDS